MSPRLLIALAIVLCLAPDSADAHMVWAGGGAFWAGFLHPLTSLDDICFVVSLSIWSTFNEPSTRLWVLGTISAVTTVAAVILWQSGQELSTIRAMATLMIVTGLAGATRFKVQSVILVPVAAIGAWFGGAVQNQ
jgi:hydrogenase/urease accessory protein HupE